MSGCSMLLSLVGVYYMYCTVHIIPGFHHSNGGGGISRLGTYTPENPPWGVGGGVHAPAAPPPPWSKPQLSEFNTENTLQKHVQSETWNHFGGHREIYSFTLHRIRQKKKRAFSENYSVFLIAANRYVLELCS
jgi:hypothetical protein